MIKINLCCGDDKKKGWLNFDNEIDIEKPLPFKNNYADIIMLSHALEHIPKPYETIRECKRVLKNGGQLRIELPTISDIIQHCKSYHPYYYLNPLFNKIKRYHSSSDYLITGFTLAYFKKKHQFEGLRYWGWVYRKNKKRLLSWLYSIFYDSYEWGMNKNE